MVLWRAAVTVAFGALTVSVPAAGEAQLWQVTLGPVLIDHDPPSNVADTGEQLPPGLALAGSYAWSSGLVLEAELSRGSDRRLGAVCGGFIIDPVSECIPESVLYSGGLAALALGWRMQGSVNSHAALGLRPRAGLGMLWVRERGRETGRTYAENPVALLIGAAAEGTYRFRGSSLALVFTLGVDQLRPISLGDCLDCRQVIRNPVPHWWSGLGLVWGTR